MEFKEQLRQIIVSINHLTNFIISKLSHFSRLSLGEQISYPVIGLGLILILVSIVLFMV